jgi:hypothetical protein
MRKRPVREIRRRIQTRRGSDPLSGARRTTSIIICTWPPRWERRPSRWPPRIDVSEEEMEAARGKFGLARAAGRPWFGLNPGAEYGPAKRWPAERFVAAARALREKTHCRWMVLEARATAPWRRRFRRHRPRHRRTAAEPGGQTSLRELAAVLKICDLVLTNDSGPMHLAAAVGAPVTAIFGSTSPELTGPVFSARAQVVRCDAPCAPCFRRECPIDLRCLRGIETEQVVAAALCVIQKTGQTEALYSMKFILTTHNVTLTKAIEDHILSRLDKLEHLDHYCTSARVSLEHDHLKRPERQFTCAIRLSVPGPDLYALDCKRICTRPSTW